MPGSNYIFGLEARNSAGNVKQYITWSFYTVNEPIVNIKGLNIREEKNGLSVKITPQIDTNSTSLKYKYQNGKQLRIQVEILRQSGFQIRVELTGFM